MRTCSKYSWEQLGITFEHDLVAIMCDYAVRSYGKGAMRRTTAAEDRYCGTDCEILSVPIDVTINFGGKNRIWRSCTEIDLGLCFVKFGVRYGNGRRMFDTPVLVIGVDTVIDIRGYMVNIMDDLRSRLNDIINVGMDIYNEKVFPEEMFI